jgi:hypothetical protein
MRFFFSKACNSQHLFLKLFATLSLGATAVGIPAAAQEPELEAGIHFFPGNLVVSRSVYEKSGLCFRQTAPTPLDPALPQPATESTPSSLTTSFLTPLLESPRRSSLTS